MRRFKVAGIAAAAAIGSVALCQPVLAQGGSDNGSSAYNWSGLSGGGFGSGLFGGGDLASALGNGSPCLAGPCYAAANAHLHDRATGGGGGLQLGYNVRSGGFLYGLEIDAMAQRLTASKDRSTFDAFKTYSFHDEINSSWMGTLRGRIGTFVGGTLLYVTGGVALTTLEYDHSYRDTGGAGSPPGYEKSSASKTVAGWTIGAGLEMPLSRSLSLRAEYMLTDFGSISKSNSNVYPLPAPAGALCSTATLNQCFSNHGDLSVNQIRIGLNFKLGDPPPDVRPLK